MFTILWFDGHRCYALVIYIINVRAEFHPL